jgi:hypothetical protein
VVVLELLFFWVLRHLHGLGYEHYGEWPLDHWNSPRKSISSMHSEVVRHAMGMDLQKTEIHFDKSYALDATRIWDGG